MARGHPASSTELGFQNPKPALSPATAPTHLSPASPSEAPSCLTEETVPGEWPRSPSGGPGFPSPAGTLSAQKGGGWARSRDSPSCSRHTGLSGNLTLSSSCPPLPGLRLSSAPSPGRELSLCAQPCNLTLPPAVPEAPSLPKALLPFSMTALPRSLQRKAGNPKP